MIIGSLIIRPSITMSTMGEYDMKYFDKTLANTDKCIENAVKSVGTARDKVQIAVVSMVYTGQKHRDIRVLKKQASTLIEGCKGLNLVGLVDCLADHGAIVNDDGIVGWDLNKLDLDKIKTEGKEWYTYKPQHPYKGFSKVERVDALIAAAVKARKDAANDPEKAKLVDADDDFMDSLKAFRATLVA